MSDYKHFGVMIDVSRNAVMKVSELKKFIDVLVKMGYNTVELYAEDTYEIEGEEYLGYLRGRYTHDEIKEIDKYCISKGVELIPCIQTLAHFTNTVKLPKYNAITDLNDILLIDDDKTYEFIDNIFKSLANDFTSRFINIGMDEAHMVGLGRYLDKHGHCDRVELLIRHLNKVCAIAEKYGFKPHMWSDMFFRLVNNGEYYAKETRFDDATKAKIPQNIELAYWDYYNCKEEIIDGMFVAHKELDRPVWFAGGCWCWTGFAPNNGASIYAMEKLLTKANVHGIENVIITLWGDNGKECSFYEVLPSLYACRRFADGVTDMAIIKAEFKEIIGYDFDAFMELDNPEDFTFNDNKDIVFDCVAKMALYNDVFLGILDDSFDFKSKIDFGAKADKLEALAKNMGEFQYVFEFVGAINRLNSKKAYLGLKTRKAYQDGDKATLKLLLKDYKFVEKQVAIFRDKFYALWMRENKPFGWEVHEIRLAGVKARIAECRKRIEAFLKGKIDKIDELEEKILPYWVDRTAFTSINVYKWLASVSEL